MLQRFRLIILFNALLATGVYAQSPQIQGIGNNASYATTGVPPGTLISIFGTQLASSTAQANSLPLSNTIAGVSVTINNVAAPLYYVGAAQINAQVPYNVLQSGTSGTANVVVTNNSSTSPAFPMVINQFAPAIYTINSSGSGYSIAYFGLPTLPGTNTPDPRFGHFVAPPNTYPGITTYVANPGDVLTIYATGLGAVNPPVASGASPNPNNPSLTTTTPTVLIGNIPATFFGAALTQYPGVYQLNIQVPTGVPAGNSVPLQIQIGGITSSSSTIIAVGSGS